MGFSLFEQIKTDEYKDINNANEIKAILLNYLRFERNYSMVTTEVYGYGNEKDDIVAVSKNNNIICIEIKTSKSDFLRDFKTKRKHKILQNLFATRVIYNKIYFAVNKNMEAFCLEYLKKNYPKYGLIVIENNKARVVKRACLYNGLESDRLKHINKYIISSMSSNLANSNSFTKLYLTNQEKAKKETEENKQ